MTSSVHHRRAALDRDALRAGGVRTVCVGKIASLFGGAGVDEELKTAGNEDGVETTLAAIVEAAASGEPTFVWTNLVDFDELYGHRNDAPGYARALEAFDAALPTRQCVKSNAVAAAVAITALCQSRKPRRQSRPFTTQQTKMMSHFQVNTHLQLIERFQ